MYNVYQFIHCLDAFSVLFFTPFLAMFNNCFAFFHTDWAQRRHFHTTTCYNCCNSSGLFISNVKIGQFLPICATLH